MPFDDDGVYTAPDGAENAFSGKVLSSATWNDIFTDISTALTNIGALYFGAPVTVSGTTATVAATTSYVICNNVATVTLTLPSAATWTGRPLWIKNVDGTATVVSASSNVIPRIGGSAGTAILATGDGAWAMLTSNGTNWEIMAGS